MDTSVTKTVFQIGVSFQIKSTWSNQQYGHDNATIKSKKIDPIKRTWDLIR